VRVQCVAIWDKGLDSVPDNAAPGTHRSTLRQRVFEKISVNETYDLVPVVTLCLVGFSPCCARHTPVKSRM
jgi:hypothetical protein